MKDKQDRSRGLRHFFFAAIILLTSPIDLLAQKEVPTIGIQVRRIVPSGLFDNASLDLQDNNYKFHIIPQASTSFGVIMRHGMYKQFSFETGIHYVERVYQTQFNGDTIKANSYFHIVNYEIPFLGLIYIKLSKKLYINNAFGVSMDFYPNDIQVNNTYFHQISLRKYWVLPALMANVGAEYRTKKNGYFYFGGSYHRMLTHMEYMGYKYQQSGQDRSVATWLNGHYFGFEFKYFFPTYRTAPVNYD